MTKENSNPFSAPIPPNPRPEDKESQQVEKSRLPLATVFMVAGVGVGVLGLALVSNRFGNTDTYGIPVVGLSGFLLGTGCCHAFMRLPTAILSGCLLGPLSIVLLFVLYWVLILLTAAFNQ